MTKKIVFEKLKIENFLSVGEIPIEIDFKKGLHIITGVNRDQADRRNAIGKSTIVDALNFALFGVTLRELKKEFIINNITKKTSKVYLKFSIHENNISNVYEIVRTLDPNKCYLHENDVDITRDSMANTSDYIQNILKLSQEVFSNCVAMTLNNTTPFMAKKKIEKRKFIENIFNLEIFSSMNSLLKEEIQESKKNYDSCFAKYDECKTTLDNLIKQEDNSKKEKEERDQRLKLRLDNFKNNLNDIIVKLDKYQLIEIEPIVQKIGEAETKFTNLNEQIYSIGKEIAALDAKKDLKKTALSKIGTDKDMCPVCLRQIDTNNKNHIKEEKEKIKKEIESYISEIKTLDEKLEAFKETHAKLNTGINKLKDIINKQKIQNEQKKNLEHKKQDIENNISNTLKDIEELAGFSNDFNAIIQEQKLKVNNLKDELDKLKTISNELDIVKFVLSEDGVRSFIVKRILSLFNNKLSYYLRKLNSNAFIKFDEYFEETIVNSKGIELSYFNFSGAEKKIIDLATMFTFIDMLRMQGNVIYNVQFYDELLDTSLDEAGVEMVVSLLNEIVTNYGYGVYVISHRKECSKLSTGDIIFLEKKNGLTTRISYED